MREVQLRPETDVTQSAMSLLTTFGITQNRNMKSILTSVESAHNFGLVRGSLEEAVTEENGLRDCAVDFFRNGFQVSDKWAMPNENVLEFTYVVRRRAND